MYQVQAVLSILDRRFRLTRLAQYCLLVGIGQDSLRIVVIEAQTGRCMAMEGYVFSNMAMADYIGGVKDFFQRHPFLPYVGWNRVVLCFENQQYTLVPTVLFKAENSIDYLKLAVNLEESLVQYCSHKDLGVTVVFGVNKALATWLSQNYTDSSCHIIHQSNSLIASSSVYLKMYKATIATRVFVLAEPSHIHITVVEGVQLLYYNRFLYQDSDEFLQYILIVMAALSLEPTMHEVVLSGNIPKNSLVYKKIINYIRKVSFSPKPVGIKFNWRYKKNQITNYLDMLSVLPATGYLKKLQCGRS